MNYGAWVLKYFNHEIIFKNYLNNPQYKIFIVIGTKNIGKTYSFLKDRINNFEKTGEKFLLIRRLVKEADEYWDEETATNPLWFNYYCKNQIIFHKDSKKPCCRVIGLNGTTEGKGKANYGYTSAIFDDFIGEQWEKPIKLFSRRLAKTISNYARDNLFKFRLFMTANLNSMTSEFLNENRIELLDKGGIQTINKNNMVIYQESPFTEDGLFALHNKEFKETALSFILEDNQLINHLLYNKSQADDYAYIKQSNITKERFNKFIIINKTVLVVSKIQDNKWLIRPLNKKDVINRRIYTFNAKNIGKAYNVTYSHDSREIANQFLNLLKKRKLFFTDMRFFEPFLTDIITIIKLGDLID